MTAAQQIARLRAALRGLMDSEGGEPRKNDRANALAWRRAEAALTSSRGPALRTPAANRKRLTVPLTLKWEVKPNEQIYPEERDLLTDCLIGGTDKLSASLRSQLGGTFTFKLGRVS